MDLWNNYRPYLNSMELTILEAHANGQDAAYVTGYSKSSVRRKTQVIVEKCFAKNLKHAIALGIHHGLIRLHNMPSLPETTDPPKPVHQKEKKQDFTRQQLIDLFTRKEMEIFEVFTLPVLPTNKLIASTLFISENTLRKHLRNMYRKLGTDRSGLIRLSALISASDSDGNESDGNERVECSNCGEIVSVGRSNFPSS